MTDYTQSGRYFNPVHIDEVPPNAGRFICVNRQSDGNNAHGHERYKPVLADDYAVFQMFLDYFFGERTSDIVFAVIDDSHPAKNRSNATKLGQAATGRRGGRPSRLSPKEEACRLAREKKWNAGRIRRHLFRYKIDASIRAFQLWLKNKGLESPPGRPKKEE
jgi:hypothetical protein